MPRKSAPSSRPSPAPACAAVRRTRRRRRKAAPLLSTEKIIALGASTGGTEALKRSAARPAGAQSRVVITQHMPPGFTRSFAERLDRLTRLSVSEARDGDRILPGHALVAPGDHHMEVQRPAPTTWCV